MNATSSRFVRDQSVIDREHVRLLAIFHFVAAGMAFLGLLFIVGHYAIFTFVFWNPEFWSKAPKGAGPPPEMFMQMLRGFYIFFGTWCVLSGVANLLSGVFMRRLQHRTFSMVVAGFNCLHIPLGTILGVFTFVVLGRDSVARAYAEAAAPPSA
jgi:hypothetical protein